VFFAPVISLLARCLASGGAKPRRKDDSYGELLIHSLYKPEILSASF
jgi:hypothetical protein